MNTPKPKQNKPFVMTPNALLFLYPFIPEYKAEMTTLYGFIVHYYNENEGYAWPNVDTLALFYGKTPKTTGEHLKVLKECGLVDSKKIGGKWHYKPVTPLEGDAFFGKFPAALEEKNKREKAREDERVRSAENMAKMRAKQIEEITEVQRQVATVKEPILYRDDSGREVDLNEWL